jgi:hypothetical protein
VSREAADRFGFLGADVISKDDWRIPMKVTKVLGLAAVGALLILAAPTQQAQAMSLSSPSAVAAVQDSTMQTTQVGWHRHWHPRWHRHWHPRWHRRWHR